MGVVGSFKAYGRTRRVNGHRRKRKKGFLECLNNSFSARDINDSMNTNALISHLLR
jgi:hypothetical protein